MANTYVDYTAVASQTDYNFSFEYLRDEHIKVKVNGTLVTNYTIVTSPVQLIRFTDAPTGGAAIKIYRDSRGDFSPLVDFVDGSVLTENELDESYKHNLFTAQEASEGQGGEQLTKKGLTHYDSEGNKIINLGTPSASTDAANKAYVDQTIDNSIALGGSPAIVSLGGYDVTAFGTSITKSLTNWTNDLNAPIATGSTTARTLVDRFGDVVNVLDYGADPASADNRTAINLAFTAAFNAGGGTVYFPTGTYTVTDYVGFFSSSTDEINIQVIADAGAVLNVNPGSDPADIRDYGLLLQSANLKTCIVRGLEVQCNDKVSVGIRVSNSSGSMELAVVEDCKVFNCKQTFYIAGGGTRVETTSAQGILVNSTAWGYKATVENCIVQGVSRNLDGVCQGVAVIGFENTNVVNNTVRDVTVHKVNVTNATNASPIVITTDGDHNFITGDLVGVSSVSGNTAANNIFTITKLTDTTFELDGSTGNGAYISGGKAISDKDADGIVVFSHQSASDYKRSQVTVSENVVKNCEGRFIKLQTEGSVTVESNLLRLDSGTLITNFRGVDTQVANATIRNNQMYILGHTGGASAAFALLQAPGSSNFSSNESFVSEFCFNNIHTQVRFPYGVVTTSPNANEDPTIHFKINDNTITRNAASDSTTATDVACDEFVRLDSNTPAPTDFDATFYLEIARNKVFAYDFIRIPFTQVDNDYTDKWFFYVYDNYRFPTGTVISPLNRDIVLLEQRTAGAFVIGETYKILTVGTTDFTLIGAADNNVGTEFTATGVGSGTGTATSLSSPYTSTCMFRNNQTRMDSGRSSGNLGWPLDANRILEGSDFGLSNQTLENMPDNPGTYGRLALTGGIYRYTKNNNRISYTSSNPEAGWQVVGGLEVVSATDISDENSNVNTLGKFIGKQIFDGTNNRVMIADGSGTTDVWYVVDGSASVTPS